MKPLKCKHCKEKFEDDKFLEEHMANVHPGNFTCPICSRKFQFKGKYSDHMKIHANSDMRYECTQCPCFFKNPGHLKNHMKEAHGEEKQIFPCTNCTKKFDSKAALNQHVRNIHNAVFMLHKCTFCPRVYGSKNSLKWHVHINHNKDFKRSKCPYCPSDFKWPHHLKVHIKKAHILKGNAPTDLIRKGFTTIRRKTNDCVVCSKNFVKKLDLMLHLKKVHKQELDIFKCCKCDAVYSLRNSLKLHLEEHRRKNTGTGHQCEQCHPDPNPVAYAIDMEEEDDVQDGQTEIEKEIIDFELTLMANEDLRRMIKLRLKKELYDKKRRGYKAPHKYNAIETVIKRNDSDMEYEVEIGCCIKEDSSLNNEVDVYENDFLSKLCDECNNEMIHCICSESTLNASQCSTNSMEKEVKICLQRVTMNESNSLREKTSKGTAIIEYKCNICSCNFTLASLLEDHMRLSHGKEVDKPKNVNKKGSEQADREAENKQQPKSKRLDNVKQKNDVTESVQTLSKRQVKLPKRFEDTDLKVEKGEAEKRGTKRGTNEMNNTNAKQAQIRTDEIKHNKETPKRQPKEAKSLDNLEKTKNSTESENNENKRRKKDSDNGVLAKDTSKLETTTRIKQKIYQCKICNDRFITPINLGRHMKLIHRKGHRCNKCRKGFSSKSQFDHHMRIKHKDKSNLDKRKAPSPKKGVKCVNPKSLKSADKMYECGKCEVFFNSKLELLKHISDVHMAANDRERFCCDQCGAKFSSKLEIREHVKFFCEYRQVM